MKVVLFVNGFYENNSQKQKPSFDGCITVVLNVYGWIGSPGWSKGVVHTWGVKSV